MDEVEYKDNPGFWIVFAVALAMVVGGFGALAQLPEPPASPCPEEADCVVFHQWDARLQTHRRHSMTFPRSAHLPQPPEVHVPKVPPQSPTRPPSTGRLDLSLRDPSPLYVAQRLEGQTGDLVRVHFRIELPDVLWAGKQAQIFYLAVETGVLDAHSPCALNFNGLTRRLLLSGGAYAKPGGGHARQFRADHQKRSGGDVLEGFLEWQSRGAGPGDCMAQYSVNGRGKRSLAVTSKHAGTPRYVVAGLPRSNQGSHYYDCTAEPKNYANCGWVPAIGATVEVWQ